ncbi:MAG TPA: YciI family protein [Caulobacteraceae bacterium]|jgi:hypothetical protein
MRVMVFGTAVEGAGMGEMPTPEAFEAMERFNEELVKAGILIAGAGLKPTAEGKRITFDGSRRVVMDGPFAETHEVVVGWSIWQVKDMDEAVAWVKRSPDPMPGQGAIELRPFYEAEDFAGIASSSEARQEGERGQLGAA